MELLNLGAAANDGSGSTLRAGGQIINDNFSELFNNIAVQDGWALDFFDQYDVGAGPTISKGIGWDGNGAGSGLAIVSRNLYAAAKTEKRLTITAGQFGRKFYFGDFWHRIQVLILMSINKDATFNPNLSFFGVCSGTTNMVASASCDNFIGQMLPNDAAGLVYNAGTIRSFFSTSLSIRYVSKRTTVVTDRGGGAGSDGRRFAGCYSDGSNSHRSLWLLDISRPLFATDATSITYQMGARETDSGKIEFTLAKRSIFDVLNEPTQSTLAQIGAQIMGSTGAASAVTGFAFDQSTGKLNAINIAWPHAFPLEISAIGVRKVY